MDDLDELSTPSSAARLIQVAVLLVAALGAAWHFGLLSAFTSARATVTDERAVAPARTVTPDPALLPRKRIQDDAGFFAARTLDRFDSYLGSIDEESGTDIRILTVKSVPGGDLEGFTLHRMRDLGIGREVGRRGMLVVYDLETKRMRIEVGDALQGDFPDGFVGYLMREHAASFFAAGNPELALRTMLFMVSYRLRSAALGDAYDPAPLAFIEERTRLASGGGATAHAGAGVPATAFLGRAATGAERAHFAPAATPAEALQLYEEWLRDAQNQIDVPLFAPGSAEALAPFPMTVAYNDYILFGEYGQRYTVTVRDDLAILVFTTTPLVSPHFFRRSADGWQMDIAAEIRDTQEVVGGPLTWRMRDSGDDYSRAFADLYEDYGRSAPILRVRGGDNRYLPIPDRSRRDTPATDD